MKFENFPKKNAEKQEPREELTAEQIQQAAEQAVQFQKKEIQELFENPQEIENPGNPEVPERQEKPSSSRMKKALCILTASAMFFTFSPKEAGAEQQKKPVPKKETGQFEKEARKYGEKTADDFKRVAERNLQRAIIEATNKASKGLLDTIRGKRR